MSTSLAATPSLNVYAEGMDERSRNTLRLFFERQLHGRCALSDEANAQAVVLDLDAHQGRDLLERQLAAHPRRPVIVLSLDDTDGLPANAVFVRKPVGIDSLAEALAAVAARLPAAEHPKTKTEFHAAAEDILQARLARRRQDDHAAPPRVDGHDVVALHLQSQNSFFHIGSTPDLDLSLPEERAKAFYDPDEFLQGHFQRALALGRRHGAGVRISSTAFQHLDVYPHLGKVLLPTARATLYAAGRLSLSPNQVSLDLLEEAPHRAGAGDRSEPTEALLWKLALWASRGRVPAGTDLDRPVYLKRWPNLPRLLTPPHGARIASLWTQQAYSLDHTARVLGVPQRLVFAFYSACAALELASPTRRSADLLVEPAGPKRSEKRNLLRLMLGKLMHDWADRPEEQAR